jgi:hypothetical protein
MAALAASLGVSDSTNRDLSLFQTGDVTARSQLDEMKAKMAAKKAAVKTL